MLPRYTLAAFSIFLFSITCLSQEWRPVTPAELTSTASDAETEADAEVIFWEVKVEDEYIRRAGFYKGFRKPRSVYRILNFRRDHPNPHI